MAKQKCYGRSVRNIPGKSVRNIPGKYDKGGLGQTSTNCPRRNTRQKRRKMVRQLGQLDCLLYGLFTYCRIYMIHCCCRAVHNSSIDYGWVKFWTTVHPAVAGLPRHHAGSGTGVFVDKKRAQRKTEAETSDDLSRSLLLFWFCVFEVWRVMSVRSFLCSYSTKERRQ